MTEFSIELTSPLHRTWTLTFDQIKDRADVDLILSKEIQNWLMETGIQYSTRREPMTDPIKASNKFRIVFTNASDATLFTLRFL